MYNELIKQWESRGYEVFFARNKGEAMRYIAQIIPNDSTISLGGSVTLDQLDAVNFLRREKYNLLDRYADMTAEERTVCFKKGLTADWLVTGTNAITKDGDLINVDGNGNRVAPLIYGTENVLVVFGKNKLVENIEEGIQRIREIAPMNAKRLGVNTPCAQDGVCHDCRCSSRICNATTIIHNCYRFPKRIKLLLIDEVLGY